MFTGIIEELGCVKKITSKGKGKEMGISLEMEPASIFTAAKQGDSIAVNGCCLTLLQGDSGEWYFELVPETLQRTAFSSVQVGECVNLERALLCGGRLGGHFVQGHVDEVGTVQEKKRLQDGSYWMEVRCSQAFLPYLIEKGSVAVEGVSLTVAALFSSGFACALIPHTAAHTTLGFKGPGSQLHLEADFLAKQLERLAHFHFAKGRSHES